MCETLQVLSFVFISFIFLRMLTRSQFYAYKIFFSAQGIFFLRRKIFFMRIRFWSLQTTFKLQANPIATFVPLSHVL